MCRPTCRPTSGVCPSTSTRTHVAVLQPWFRTLFSVSENDRVWALVCLAVFLPPWSVVRLENIRFLLLSCSVLSQSAYVLSFSCECRSVSACHICIVQVAYMYMYVHVHCSEAWRDDRNLHLYLARRQRTILSYTAHPQLLILAEVKKSAPYTRRFTVLQCFKFHLGHCGHGSQCPFIWP